MRLPDALLNIVAQFAWLVVPRTWVVTAATLRDQLDCALDCQRNIPPWFLNDMDFSNIGARLPYMRIKHFNPLILGAAYTPFDPTQIELNRRSLTWLFNAITKEYLDRKHMLRKPLFRLLERPVLNVWNKLLAKIGDLTTDDINPRGYTVTLITTVMVSNLPCAGPVGNWQKRFEL